VLATPVTVKAGNNGTFDNVIAAGTNGIPTAASHAAAVSLGVPLFATSYVAQAPSLPLVNLGTAVTFKVTTAATGTGGFVMKGKLIYVYMAQPLASI
jgi:hypothetical protein